MDFHGPGAAPTPLPILMPESIDPPACAMPSCGGEVVCHCYGVTRSQIEECVLGGDCCLRDIMDRTRAGRGCMACRSRIKRLIADLETTVASA